MLYLIRYIITIKMKSGGYFLILYIILSDIRIIEFGKNANSKDACIGITLICIVIV